LDLRASKGAHESPIEIFDDAVETDIEFLSTLRRTADSRAP
jgi:hypothetical protein